jgi:hypothetical protein
VHSATRNPDAPRVDPEFPVSPVCGDNKGAGPDGSNSIIHVALFGETRKGGRIRRLGEPGSWLKGAYLFIVL